MIIDRYVFKQTLVATLFVTAILSVLVFLTQSLRFLDLVMEAGVSGMTLWIQTLLYMPGFFEIILPLGTVASILFIYNRMMIDSELVVLRALGSSPLRLARPALVLAVILGAFLFVNMGWIAPLCKAQAINLRQEISAKMTTLVFREGIFNEAGSGVMVYIRNRDAEGNLSGLIIHDGRDTAKPPVTIIAERGQLVIENGVQKVLVYNGARQQLDHESGTLQNLSFAQYTVDLPEKSSSSNIRLAEPSERSFGDLVIKSRKDSGENAKTRRLLRTEMQKRVLTPFLVPAYAMTVLAIMLLGSFDRRGQSKKILLAIAAIVVLQILFLTSYNLAKQSMIGLPFMLLTILVPLILSSAVMLRGLERLSIKRGRQT